MRRYWVAESIYRPAIGDIKVFAQIWKDIFSKNKIMKHMMFAGDFNMNMLDYE